MKGLFLERVADARHALLEPVEEFRKRRQLAITLRDGTHVGDEAGRIFDVPGLAVAMADAREDTQHFQMALQSHPFDIAPEFAEIRGDREPGAARAFPVADCPVQYALLGPADEGVLEETRDVVADGTDHGVLKIEN